MIKADIFNDTTIALHDEKGVTLAYLSVDEADALARSLDFALQEIGLTAAQEELADNARREKLNED